MEAFGHTNHTQTYQCIRGSAKLSISDSFRITVTSLIPMHILILMRLAIGIGANDILKLKSAGYWTVAVF